MAWVRRGEAVEDDVLKIALWISKDSRSGAERFLDAVESTIVNLRLMPGRGSPKALRVKGIVDLRSWKVRGFPNHLILYDLRGGDVYVLAVVHGHRRYRSVLSKRV